MSLKKREQTGLARSLSEKIDHHRTKLESANPEEALVLCLDNSSSMGDYVEGQGRRSKLDVLKDSVLALVAETDSGVTWLGIVVFGFVPGQWIGLESPNHFNCGAATLVPPTNKIGFIRDRAYTMRSGGDTPMDAGLAMALQALEGCPGGRRILLFSDGAATCPHEDVMAAAERAHEYNTAIDSVGIASPGGSPHFELLRQVSEITGGVFRAIEDVRSLPGAFRQLETRKRRLLT